MLNEKRLNFFGLIQTSRAGGQPKIDTSSLYDECSLPQVRYLPRDWSSKKGDTNNKCRAGALV